jgi:hypothetical protein
MYHSQGHFGRVTQAQPYINLSCSVSLNVYLVSSFAVCLAEPLLANGFALLVLREVGRGWQLGL